jgi:hypothetical protein
MKRAVMTRTLKSSSFKSGERGGLAIDPSRLMRWSQSVPCRIFRATRKL